MSELREQIAFAMWNKGNPEHIRRETTLESLGEIVTTIGNGHTMHLDLKMDWELNRDCYLDLADIAIVEIKKSRC